MRCGTGNGYSATRTAKSTFYTMLVMLSVAMLVTAYVNWQICIVLVIVTLILALTTVIWNAYYSKKL